MSSVPDDGDPSRERPPVTTHTPSTPPARGDVEEYLNAQRRVIETGDGMRIIYEAPTAFATSGGGVRAVAPEDGGDLDAMRDELTKLAWRMELKSVPLRSRGAKGIYAIRDDPDAAAAAYADQLVRSNWNAAYFRGETERRDILAPDARTNTHTMGVMVRSIQGAIHDVHPRTDEARALDLAKSVVASKPEDLGGNPDARVPATGFILRLNSELLGASGLTALGTDVDRPMRTVVHGLGNVGGYYIRSEIDRVGQLMRYPGVGPLHVAGVADRYGLVHSRGGAPLDIAGALAFHDAWWAAGRPAPDRTRELVRLHLGSDAALVPFDEDPGAYLDVPDIDRLVLASPGIGYFGPAEARRLAESNPSGADVVEGGNESISDDGELALLEAGFSVEPGEEANVGGRAFSDEEVNRPRHRADNVRAAYLRQRQKHQARVAAVTVRQREIHELNRRAGALRPDGNPLHVARRPLVAARALRELDALLGPSA